MLTSSTPSPDMENKGLFVDVLPLLLSITIPPLAPAFSKILAFSVETRNYIVVLISSTYLFQSHSHELFKEATILQRAAEWNFEIFSVLN